MKKLLVVVVALLLLSCTDTVVPETTVVFSVEKSIVKGCRYFIRTDAYSFYSNKSYSIGDTIKIGRISK